MRVKERMSKRMINNIKNQQKGLKIKKSMKNTEIGLCSVIRGYNISNEIAWNLFALCRHRGVL